MDSFRQKFIEEAREFLQELEEALLDLEGAPEDKDVVERIFRIMHTLKGNSAMFGFERIDEFTHELESIYDLLRNGKLEVSKQMLDLTLVSVDHISALLDEDPDEASSLEEIHRDLLEKIAAVNRGGAGEEPVREPSGLPAGEKDFEEAEAGAGEKSTWYVRFQPGDGILRNGTNPLYTVDDFRELGQYIAIPDDSRLPDIDDMDPELAYVGWDILLATESQRDAIQELFMFVEDNCQLDIQRLGDGDLLEEVSFVDGALKVLSEDRDNALEQMKKLAGHQSPASLPASGGPKQNHREKHSISSIRVSSDKLDELMNLVSELVTSQASLTLLSEQIMNPEIVTLAENMEKITRQLRESTFDICLIPVETMVTRFHRLVRDLSSELGKEVDFQTEGTETELDKNMIESLSDPLMHILRNSLDHGIESGEERLAAGKPARGKISLKAYYSGMNVYIQVSDDGAGIDPEKIRRKAIEKGLLSEDVHPGKKEIFDLLFVPGFSTAEKVTEVSGRGVGMDVVRRKIEDIRGSVQVDSEIGYGSTFTIKLPLTLSILDGLLVKIEDTFYVVQLSVVDKVWEIPSADLKNSSNNLINLGGDLYPFLNMREEFLHGGEVPDITRIVLVRYEEQQVGLCVDEIIGEYQAVLKPLDKMFRKQDMVSGATILGDGTVALVLDSNKIIDRVVSESVKELGERS